VTFDCVTFVMFGVSVSNERHVQNSESNCSFPKNNKTFFFLLVVKNLLCEATACAGARFARVIEADRNFLPFREVRAVR
jgi:hypothetical protein